MEAGKSVKKKLILENKDNYNESVSIREFAESAVFGKICRLCLGFNKELHDVETLDKGLIVEMHNFTGIRINKESKLPNVICDKCVKMLISMRKFKKQCQKSQKQLRHLQTAVPELAFKCGSFIEDIDAMVGKIIACFKDETRVGSMASTRTVKKESDTSFDSCQTLTDMKVEVEASCGADDAFADEATADVNTADWSSANKKVVKKEFGRAFSIDDVPFLPIKVTQDIEKLKDTNPELYRKELKKCICGICGKTYANRNCLKNHYNFKHISELAFVCDECGKGFASLAGLNSHKATHSNVKRFVCAICGHRTRIRSGMTSHMRTHTSVKRYKCDVCGEAFRASAQRNRHRSRHGADKPYECNVCHKSFTDSRNLSDHKAAIHEGQRRYACELCPAAFGYREPLRHHRRVAHSEIRTRLSKERAKEREDAMKMTIPLHEQNKQSTEDIIMKIDK